ncbi:hypothetical protein HNY73_012385 [Argiope bruennichi]|uniref:Uncharacterized protein n=1 Tax=Argiope bruennichi TaxID=94029 RepID=A0A8T0F0F6_ARGBR|nr:hypothetical protein HNY73_012385 [Argiope bruennichi]
MEFCKIRPIGTDSFSPPLTFFFCFLIQQHLIVCRCEMTPSASASAVSFTSTVSCTPSFILAWISQVVNFPLGCFDGSFFRFERTESCKLFPPCLTFFSFSSNI